MTTTKQIYDVFRAENRAGGAEQWLGTVEACDIEQAQIEAEGQYECRETCSIYVREAKNES